MDFSQVSAFLKLTPFMANSFQQRWDESEKAFPAAIPECLTEPYLRGAFAKIHYREDLSAELVETAKKIVALPELYHFVWHVIHRTFLDPYGGTWMPNYTIPAEILGERAAGLVNLIIALAYEKPIEDAFRQMGLPPEYAIHQHQWIAGTIDIYRHAHHDLPGHSLVQTAWMRLGIDKQLFRIGRFEYYLEKNYPEWMPLIYRSRKDGSMVYLAQNGWALGADGKLCRKEEAVRTLSFSDTDGKIIGTRVRYQGTFDREQTVLDAEEYVPISAPWTPNVTFHIPGGERMTPESAIASLKEAYAFFKKYLHREIPFIACTSWILNPEWQKRLPDSNLAKLQQSLFHFPSAVTNNDDGIFFLFGDGVVSPDYVPKNTMQRTMLQVIKEGIPLRSGVVVIPTSRLDDFGHPERF